MAKTNISFNNKNYSIDDTSLSSAADALKSHLSTTMNGTGAVINLGGAAYNIDSAKLTAITNAFVQHLGTIAGNGYKVVVGGVEYGVDAAKMTGAIAEIEAVLGGAISGGGDVQKPEKNEYGFYYNVPYVYNYEDVIYAFIFFEDDYLIWFANDNNDFKILCAENKDNYTYDEISHTITDTQDGTYIFSEDGKSFECAGMIFVAAGTAHGIYYDDVYVSSSGETIMFTKDNTVILTRDDVSEEIFYIQWVGNDFKGYLDGRHDFSASIDGETLLVSFVGDGTYAYHRRKDDDGSKSYTAGLYETGAIALYNEQGAEAIEGMMIKSWDELVSSGVIVINDGVVSIGFVLPDNLPEKNEYGFYFDVSYEGIIFHEDGSCSIDGDVIPAGTIVYGANSIDMSALDIGVAQVSDDGFTLIFEDFSVSLYGQPNLDGDLLMPNDGSVTEIGNEAFHDQYNLTNITIPEGVASIGEGAFVGCSNLVSVNIPNSVTSIGIAAFSYCSSLTSIAIPSSVTTIGESAFNNCGLTSIDIPDSVISIGDNAFSWCSNLTNITIPSSVTTISPQLVMGCTKLTSIDIPEGVTTIGESAFYDCNNLMSIDIPDSVISIGDSAFSKCSNLMSVTIPSSVTTIGKYAFRYCNNLTSITVPEGVTTIGDNAFGSCDNLTSITIPSSVTTISIQLVMDCTNLTSITFGGTVEQWKAFTLPSNWNYNVPATYVQCSDGIVALTEK